MFSACCPIWADSAAAFVRGSFPAEHPRLTAAETPAAAHGGTTPAVALAAHVRAVEDTDPGTLPALLESEKGATVVYAGKLNMIYGEPGTTKSWIALLAAA